MDAIVLTTTGSDYVYQYQSFCFLEPCSPQNFGLNSIFTNHRRHSSVGQRYCMRRIQLAVAIILLTIMEEIIMNMTRKLSPSRTVALQEVQHNIERLMESITSRQEEIDLCEQHLFSLYQCERHLQQELPLHKSTVQ